MACSQFPYARTGPSLVIHKGKAFQSFSLSFKKALTSDFPKTLMSRALMIAGRSIGVIQLPVWSRIIHSILLEDTFRLA
jgi:hypothetical protein